MLILGGSLSWLVFLSVCRLCGSSVAYSRHRVALFGKKKKLLTGPCWDVYYLIFVRAHTPSSVNVINVSSAIFKLTEAISVYQALFLCAGYQANTHRVMLNDCVSARWSPMHQYLALTLPRDSHPLPTRHICELIGGFSSHFRISVSVLPFPYFGFRFSVFHLPLLNAL